MEAYFSRVELGHGVKQVLMNKFEEFQIGKKIKYKRDTLESPRIFFQNYIFLDFGGKTN